MTGKAITILSAVVLSVALVCVGGVVTLAGAASACTALATPSGAQTSDFPDAYANREAEATSPVAMVLAQPDPAASAGKDCISTAGWMKPIAGAVVSGFRTAQRPSHDGVDIAAGRGTPVHAAASAVVLVVLCNAFLTDGTPYTCDVDGHPDNVLGCGWYTELLHPDQTVTRYCHLLRQPLVKVGQQVTVGQVIGMVGNSGNSSGPHLHLETHVGHPAVSANAVDPVAFFAARGINLYEPS